MQRVQGCGMYRANPAQTTRGAMMLASLTGFGRSEVSDGLLKYSLEIRSVNGRFLEIHLRIPRSLARFESEIQSRLRKRLSRGKVTLTIQEPRSITSADGMNFDTQAVKELVSGLRKLSSISGLNDDLALSHLLPLLDSLRLEEDEDLAEGRLALVLQGVDKVLQELVAMQLEEGGNLERELRSRIDCFEDIMNNIETLAADNRNSQLERLRQRIEQYIPREKVDPGRLEQETAFLIDKIDITEEIVRMRSHMALFVDALDQGNNVGKRLNFILQEMNREVNTMSSKASSAEVSGWVVQIKEELEKMREQVQNIA